MRRLAAIAGVVVILILLGVAQLVLPGIAAQTIRDRLARNGQVLAVKVSAFPAIELLAHQADSVVVRLGRYRLAPGRVGGTLGQSADTGTLDASAQEFDTGLLTLRNASLHKRGSTLTGSAEVTEASLRAALPILQSVTPVASSAGELTLRGTATLFGVTATVDVVVRAENGALVAQPAVPFGGLATIQLFSDPHVYVQSVGASSTATGFSVTATARLR
jgi:hypothetical protein